MKKIFFAIIALILLVPATPSQAQTRPWTEYVKPSGLFQAGISTDHSLQYSLYVRRARIAISGTVLDNSRYGKLEYLLRANLLGSPSLLDGFVKYTLRPEFGIQLGQFRTPLLIENTEYSASTVEMIEYSILVQRFCHFGKLDLAGVSNSGRDIGIQFYGNFLQMGDGHHLFQYNVGVFNGSAINKADSDQRKEYMARLMVFPMKELAISGSYARAMGPHPEIAPEYNDYDWYVYDRYGAGVWYKSRYGWFRAEYMGGHTHGYKARGLYATAGYNINDQFNAGLRYDYFVTNTWKPESSTEHRFTVGGTWRPISFFKLQLNYSYDMQPAVAPIHLVNLQASVIF